MHLCRRHIKKGALISKGSKKGTGDELLSRPLIVSTIAAEALHFCVRNGNRCFILAIVTGKRCDYFW